MMGNLIWYTVIAALAIMLIVALLRVSGGLT